VGPRAGLYAEVRGQILLPLPGIELRSPGRPARTQTLYWLSYPALQNKRLAQDNKPQGTTPLTTSPALQDNGIGQYFRCKSSRSSPRCNDHMPLRLPLHARNKDLFSWGKARTTNRCGLCRTHHAGSHKRQCNKSDQLERQSPVSEAATQCYHAALGNVGHRLITSKII